MTYTIDFIAMGFLTINRTITNQLICALTDKYLIMLFVEYETVLINTFSSYDITTSLFINLIERTAFN